MTRDEIMNMPAGRELDALVAEKVMGWISNGVTWSLPEAHDGYPGYGIEYWNPSVSLEAAWQVVGKMHDEIMYFEMHRTGHYNASWNVQIGHYIFSEAKTASLAICRAALLAVLESEE